MAANSKSDVFARFARYLAEQDMAERTVDAYWHDVKAFARWLEQSNDCAFTVQESTLFHMHNDSARLFALRGGNAMLGAWCEHLSPSRFRLARGRG